MSSSPSRTVVFKKVTSAIDGLQIYAEAIGDPANPAIVYIHGVSNSLIPVHSKRLAHATLFVEFLIVWSGKWALSGVSV